MLFLALLAPTVESSQKILRNLILMAQVAKVSMKLIFRRLSKVHAYSGCDLCAKSQTLTT